MELKVNIFLSFTSSHFPYQGAPFNNWSQSPYPVVGTNKLASRSSALQGGSWMQGLRDRLDPAKALQGHWGRLQSWQPSLQNFLQDRELWDGSSAIFQANRYRLLLHSCYQWFYLPPQQSQRSLVLFSLCISWCHYSFTQSRFPLAPKKATPSTAPQATCGLYSSPKQTEITWGPGWGLLPACCTFRQMQCNTSEGYSPALSHSPANRVVRKIFSNAHLLQLWGNQGFITWIRCKRHFAWSCKGNFCNKV